MENLKKNYPTDFCLVNSNQNNINGLNFINSKIPIITNQFLLGENLSNNTRKRISSDISKENYPKSVQNNIIQQNPSQNSKGKNKISLYPISDFEQNSYSKSLLRELYYNNYSSIDLIFPKLNKTGFFINNIVQNKKKNYLFNLFGISFQSKKLDKKIPIFIFPKENINNIYLYISIESSNIQVGNVIEIQLKQLTEYTWGPDKFQNYSIILPKNENISIIFEIVIELRVESKNKPFSTEFIKICYLKKLINDIINNELKIPDKTLKLINIDNNYEFFINFSYTIENLKQFNLPIYFISPYETLEIYSFILKLIENRFNFINGNFNINPFDISDLIMFKKISFNYKIFINLIEEWDKISEENLKFLIRKYYIYFFPLLKNNEYYLFNNSDNPDKLIIRCLNNQSFKDEKFKPFHTN